MLGKIIIILIPVLVLLIIIYMIKLYNTLKKLEITVKKAYSNIDVDLRKRSDLIPKLVDTVKGYMHHEQELLTKLVETRNNLIDTKDKEEINKNDNEIRSLLRNIFAHAENYPDLKASDNFLQLQEEILKIEEELVESRTKYNQSVLNFNNKYTIFPNKIFAIIFGFKKQEYFKISEEEKENPDLDLN